MAKITVKHYLNDKVNPIENKYPVYVQLVFKRKPNFLKSFTKLYLSLDHKFKYSELDILDIETKLNSGNLNNTDLIELRITREKYEIEKAIEILNSHSKGREYQRKGIKNYFTLMFEPLEKVLINSFWNELLSKIDKEKEPDYYQFCNIFSKEESLSNIITCIDGQIHDFAKRVGRLNDNLFWGSIGSELFKPEHVKLWEDTQTVLNVLFYNSDPLLIDWFLFDIEKKLKIDYPDIEDNRIKNIIEILDNTIHSYLST